MELISTAGPSRDGRPRTARKAWTVRAREGAERSAGVTLDLASLSMPQIYPLYEAVKRGITNSMKRTKVEPVGLLAAVAESVDDGFCLAAELDSRFPRLSHRDLVRLRKRAVGRGLLLERRGPDGRIYSL